MKKNIGRAALVLLVATTLSASAVWAQVEKDGAMASGAKPALDPFRVLIVKAQPVRQQRTYVPKVRAAPVIPQLKLQVLAVAGEAPDFVAVVKYKDKEEIIEKGYEPPDKSFKVRAIHSDKLEVYHTATQSLKEFHF